MSFINRSCKIGWQGTEVRIDITNDLCHSLEEAGINLFALSVEFSRGGTPKFFLLARLVTALLNFSGVNAEEDDVVKAVTTDPKASIAMYKFAKEFLSKVFPAPEVEEAPPVGKPKKVKAKK
ncbi:MAG: hypothetical protein ABNH21_06560 [Glaciecola sp.]|jgi:NADH/NAD ratio-sensing transcriptional regulator Rex